MSTSLRPQRTLLILCLCCGCWAFGYGLEFPLASRWLQDAGRPASFIGFNIGAHFVGCLLTVAIVPLVMRSAGRAGILVGLLCSGIGVASFPWVDGVFGLFALRLLAGAGGALTMISLETFINLNAPPERRARDFAFYACSVTIGFALGCFGGLQLFAIDPELSFLIGGGITLTAVPLLLLLPALTVPPPEPKTCQRLRAPFLSFGSSWCQGFLETGMLALLPLYLRAVGLSDGASGTLIGGILVGVLICQIPIGGLADLVGRERVLVGCFLMVAIGLMAVPGVDNPAGRFLWLFVIGVCSGAFYPLGLALLGERLTPAQLPQANVWFVGMNSLGSMIGPLVSGPVMDRYGPQAMFWTAEVVVVGVLAIWVMMRLGQWPVRLAGLRLPTIAPGSPVNETVSSSDAASNR